jgi:large subunit ribosomal protein L3
MAQIFDDTGKAIPVTVIQAGPCYVAQKKAPDTDGYAAVQIGYQEVRPDQVNSPLRGHFAKHKVRPLHFLREIRLAPEELEQYQVGQEVNIGIFASGEYVDVVGTSRGKGFAGCIKRHNFHRGPMTHGSKYHRRTGSLGAKGPARVFKGRKMPGRMGGERVTAQNLQVVKVDTDKNLILVHGAVPGPRKGLLVIKNAQR